MGKMRRTAPKRAASAPVHTGACAHEDENTNRLISPGRFHCPKMREFELECRPYPPPSSHHMSKPHACMHPCVHSRCPPCPFSYYPCPTHAAVTCPSSPVCPTPARWSWSGRCPSTPACCTIPSYKRECGCSHAYVHEPAMSPICTRVPIYIVQVALFVCIFRIDVDLPRIIRVGYRHHGRSGVWRTSRLRGRGPPTQGTSRSPASIS